MAFITRENAEALIPVEQVNEIAKGIETQSTALRLLRRLPNMGAKQAKLPVLSSLISAGFVSGDTGLKPTTDTAWESKVITAEEIATIVAIPEAVLDDSTFDIWGEITPQAVQQFGELIDKTIYFASGSEKPTTYPDGLAVQAIAKGNTVASGTGSDLADDVNLAMIEVEKDGFEVSNILTDVQTKGNLRGLRDENKQPIFTPAIPNVAPSTIWGVPADVQKGSAWDSTKASVLCGDFSQAVYSIRQDMTMKLLTEAIISDSEGKVVYNFAQQDMVGLRIVMRLGWQVANPVNTSNPDADSRFPFAVVTPVTP